MNSPSSLSTLWMSCVHRPAFAETGHKQLKDSRLGILSFFAAQKNLASSYEGSC